MRVHTRAHQAQHFHAIPADGLHQVRDHRGRGRDFDFTPFSSNTRQRQREEQQACRSPKESSAIPRHAQEHATLLCLKQEIILEQSNFVSPFKTTGMTGDSFWKQ